MSAPKNSLLAFFASVQLALFLLGLMASTWGAGVSKSVTKAPRGGIGWLVREKKGT